ncbi:MAG: metal ABC transporter substrate-binding protein [Corynebacterium provencense]|jgi:manganese transport system substrate-binding protein|uniref:metal ABC transporter substrate-binding protein n=1 Tax=Corynebacterium provencense TaxID=1737425 RepID=UPI002989EA24|nr:metal ABC transporter substrate-binding protein [Corynebacterium provencense]
MSLPLRRALAGLGLSASVVAGLTACGSGSEDSTDVLATFTILADMTRAVAGDAVTVTSLTRPGAEVHGYDPTPGDIRAAAEADLVITNGFGLEKWLDKLVADSDATRVTATDGITPVNIEGTDDPNPHAWMSPALAKVYVDNITTALTERFPGDADTFRTNASSYKDQLDEVDRTMQDGLSRLPANQRALQTCEGAFSYLTREAGMSESYIWPVNSDQEITPTQIRDAATFVKDNDVPAVFCESTVEPGPKEQLIRETGAADGGTLYVDSLTEEGGDAPTYLDLIRYDTETIISGLSRGGRQ